jgi:hypothetical protein
MQSRPESNTDGTRLAPRLIFLKIHVGSDLVVRGGVEPPTFRFSGARMTVQARPRQSFAVLSGRPWSAIDPSALR